jgi:hypothetical protein
MVARAPGRAYKPHMAGPRRQPPPPLPPPLRGVVVDGANVIATSKVHPIERLDLATAWCQRWRPDLPVLVFLDRSTARRCRPAAQRVLRARCEDVTPGRARYVVCPEGEGADEHVLRHARAQQALVLSNDRYFDFEDLRANVITVQFTLAGDDLRVADEATWFRSPGTAVRVAMATLQALGRPAAE